MPKEPAQFARCKTWLRSTVEASWVPWDDGANKEVEAKWGPKEFEKKWNARMAQRERYKRSGKKSLSRRPRVEEHAGTSRVDIVWERAVTQQSPARLLRLCRRQNSLFRWVRVRGLQEPVKKQEERTRRRDGVLSASSTLPPDAAGVPAESGWLPPAKKQRLRRKTNVTWEAAWKAAQVCSEEADR